MCVNNNKIAKFLMREELYIDAPIMEDMTILRVILKEAGFREGMDMLVVQTRYNDQYTVVKIIKTVPYRKENGEQTGEEMRYFHIQIPDRYVPATHHSDFENNVKIVKSCKDVRKLVEEINS